MNSPVDPALLQLVDQKINSLQDDVNLMSVEVEEEKARVQQELQNIATLLEEMKLSVQNLEDRVDDFQGTRMFNFPLDSSTPNHSLLRLAHT